MFIGFLAIALVIYLLFKDNGSGASVKDDAALQALKQRFVNGEIDEQTYIRMRSVISK